MDYINIINNQCSFIFWSFGCDFVVLHYMPMKMFSDWKLGLDNINLFFFFF